MQLQPHYIAQHYTTLITLHYATSTITTRLHYTTLHILHYTTLHYTTPQHITLHYTALHCTALHYTLHYTTLHPELTYNIHKSWLSGQGIYIQLLGLRLVRSFGLILFRHFGIFPMFRTFVVAAPHSIRKSPQESRLHRTSPTLPLFCPCVQSPWPNTICPRHPPCHRSCSISHGETQNNTLGNFHVENHWPNSFVVTWFPIFQEIRSQPESSFWMVDLPPRSPLKSRIWAKLGPQKKELTC